MAEPPRSTSWASHLVQLTIVGAIVGIMVRLYQAEQRLDLLEQEAEHAGYVRPHFRPIRAPTPPRRQAADEGATSREGQKEEQEDHEDQEDQEDQEGQADAPFDDQNSEHEYQDPSDEDEGPPPSA